MDEKAASLKFKGRLSVTKILRRKSFYIYDSHTHQMARHIYDTYRTKGVRITESEIVREALDLYFQHLGVEPNTQEMQPQQSSGNPE